LKIKSRSKKDCEFDYRMSIFKKEGDREIILSARFKLRKGDRQDIKKSTQEKVDYRIDRHPLDLPNIGSTFKNFPVEKAPKELVKEFASSIKPDPFPVIPAAKLIIGIGAMGERVGGAQISTKHPNFLVNTGGAKASDVMGLIDKVRGAVKSKYGVELELEIMLI
jgi:UDP-N-acetylmuramate dehydrogenase